MEDIKNDKRDRLRTALLNLSPEQMAEYYRWAAVRRDFVHEMDISFVQAMIEGKTGWEDKEDSIFCQCTDQVDIDNANWCLISWYTRNKPKTLLKETEAAIEEDFELNFPIIGSSLYKIVSNDNGETFMPFKIDIITANTREAQSIGKSSTDIGVARGYIPHGKRLAKVNPWKEEQNIVEIWY